MSRSLPSFEEVSAPVFVPAFLHTNLDDVRKLRDRIRPAPGNLQREQFDLGKIPFTVP
jgi:hypothetical protein